MVVGLASFPHLLLGQSLSAHIYVLRAILVIAGVRPGKIEANTITLVNATARASATVASALNGGMGLRVTDVRPIRRFAFSGASLSRRPLFLADSDEGSVK